MSKNDHQFAAFTLIELLIVITIIAGLLAIVVPLMTRVKERVRRTLCQNNIRLFFTGIYIYAYDHQQLLPSDFPNERINHTPALTPQCRDALINRIGHNKILECPSLGGPYKNADGWNYEGVGYIIGYNYLGGHPKTPWTAYPGYTEWKSPQKITERTTVPIIAELNAWMTPHEKRTFAPHGIRGPIVQFAEEGKGGFPSQKAGAVGGNICAMDGSIRWKDIKDMKLYRASAYGDVCSTVW